MNRGNGQSNWYYKESLHRATFAVLYCNLIINISYGLIYVLLHEILFLDTWTNIAISLAFTETVILFYTIITAHNEKIFMLRWMIYTLLLSSSFITCRIVYSIYEQCELSYVDQAVEKVAHHFPNIFSNHSVEFMKRYSPTVIASFTMMTLFFKYYSAWSIYQCEFKRNPTKTPHDIFSRDETEKSCKPAFISPG